jgi:glycosyltransferase involved in cell wall biosynthesis
MRTIRLAYLCGRLTVGGAELQMIALTKRLTRQGFRVDFLVRAGAGPLDARARDAGATVRVIGELSSPATPALVRYARRVSKNARWITTARRERYDIVDAWLNPTDVVAALSRPLTRTPVVMAARLGRTPRMRLGPATPQLNAVVHRLIDVLVANAEITAADAIEEGMPARSVRIIRGGVELPKSFTVAERQAQRAALGATEDEFLIGCVGRFRSMKRQDLLIDALARLLPSHSNLRLVLVGDGELRPKIERHIEALGLGQRVTLFGTATDLPPLYSAFDLVVQASNSEALPNVLLEASASARPIVATAAGGTGEVIRDGVTGLLVPVDDLDSLVSAIDRLVADADLRDRMGAAARALVEHEYGMDRFVREYADLYREQLAAKRRHAS